MRNGGILRVEMISENGKLEIQEFSATHLSAFPVCPSKRSY
jgi:hypothetical protein